MIDTALVRARLDAIVDAMKREGAWDVAPPGPDAFLEMGAFGSNTMAFEQWLRFVFVPNVETLIASRGPWPTTSQIAAHATREGDTNPAVAALVPALSEFDALFDGELRAEAAYLKSRELYEARDYEAALAAVREALDANPLHPNAQNFAGYLLLSKPDRTQEDLEAAVAHLKKAPGSTALANLGDALVALDRDDEAVAIYEREPESAETHNWLGWFFTARRRDLPRAIAHLEAAVELRPEWGVAWLNLAKAHDANGNVVEACRAFGEAITRANSHDDAFARDRRLQLEMQLRTRGETPPPVPASARADSAAIGIVLATAAKPEFRAGWAFLIRPTAKGDAPFAGIATVVGGRALGHAIVRDLEEKRFASVLVRADPLAMASVPADDPRAAAELLAEWLRAGGADPDALTPFDAAVYLLDLLQREPPRRFRISPELELPATIALIEENGNLAIRVRARAGGGVVIVFGDEIDVPTPARMLEVGPMLLERVRTAR